MTYMGTNPILTHLVEVNPRNIHKNLKEPYASLKENSNI